MWYIGVLINVVGSLSINLSTNVLKLSHSQLDALVITQDGDEDGADGAAAVSAARRGGNDDDEQEHRGPEAKTAKPQKKKAARNPKAWYNLRLAPNRLWLLAMIVFVVANLANFASFAFAAQSLLAALGSIQFVSNVAFARLVNKERITPHTVVGTLIIVAGCVTLVLFGPHDSPSYTVDELMALYGNAAYISYLCVGVAVVIGSYIAYWWIKRRRQTRVLGLYVLFSALVGTQSVLYGKSLSLLFRASLAGTNVVKSWYSWACLLAFLVAAFYWVRRFNKGLRYFDVMRAMPAMQVGWILFSLVSGGLYFQEFRGFTGLQWGVFTLGVAGVIGGVVLIFFGGSGRVGVVRRVSTVYDAVGIDCRPGDEAGGSTVRRSCVTAHCYVRCEGEAGGDGSKQDARDLEAARGGVGGRRGGRQRTTTI